MPIQPLLQCGGWIFEACKRHSDIQKLVKDIQLYLKLAKVIETLPYLYFTLDVAASFSKEKVGIELQMVFCFSKS